VPRPTRGLLCVLPVRGCHPLWPAVPDGSGSDRAATGLVRVRSPLLAESRLMSFPPGTEMFQFPGFASTAYGFSGRYPCGWVAPFGDLGLKACSRLPQAFRSVPRPSSPLGAKASTRCPCFPRPTPATTAPWYPMKPPASRGPRPRERTALAKRGRRTAVTTVGDQATTYKSIPMLSVTHAPDGREGGRASMLASARSRHDAPMPKLRHRCPRTGCHHHFTM
jgi:hypothetical protein